MRGYEKGISKAGSPAGDSREPVFVLGKEKGKRHGKTKKEDISQVYIPKEEDWDLLIAPNLRAGAAGGAAGSGPGAGAAVAAGSGPRVGAGAAGVAVPSPGLPAGPGGAAAGVAAGDGELLVPLPRLELAAQSVQAGGSGADALQAIDGAAALRPGTAGKAGAFDQRGAVTVATGAIGVAGAGAGAQVGMDLTARTDQPVGRGDHGPGGAVLDPSGTAKPAGPADLIDFSASDGVVAGAAGGVEVVPKMERPSPYNLGAFDPAFEGRARHASFPLTPPVPYPYGLYLYPGGYSGGGVVPTAPPWHTEPRGRGGGAAGEFPASSSQQQGAREQRRGSLPPLLLPRNKESDVEPSGDESDSSEEEEAPVVKPKVKASAAPTRKVGKRLLTALSDPDPIARRTRKGKEKLVLEAPLRQAMGNQGPMYIKTPFSLVELQQWKASVGSYRDNPDKVANYVERAIKTQDPDWFDLEVLMDTLLDSTEKEMVKRAAKAGIQLLRAAGQISGEVLQIFPPMDPKWDPNVPAQREALTRYQEYVVYGFRHAIPKAVNWAKMYEVKQDKNESPTDFLNKLKDVIRKYTDIDTESDTGKKHLVNLFIGQSADDIRRKLQKAGDKKDISELLDIAWVVYRNREQKGKTKVLELEEDDGHGHCNCQERRKHNTQNKGCKHHYQYDRCSYCKKKGHWRKDCPDLRKDENPPLPPPVPQLTVSQNA
ncbi:uncharacterized protein [Pithys albifrons albifrons]|uniref:uncharacterized protein n=1 Tax=Pithys albifrons albifrons TaxID=3385563 RepID=UPI003A5CFF2E